MFSVVKTLSQASIITLLAACSSGGAPRQQASPGLLSPTPRTASTSVVESEEPWKFNGKPGKVIRTYHYRLFTTESDPVLISRLPGFMEAALSHYTSALGPLPSPEFKLDTFLMATRAQWTQLTQQLMGSQAASFLRIPRGGYASSGRAIYYDIGAQDTMAIASHEGWHQYTQRTFKDLLPVWLEEGVATYMEGHRWDGATPIFLPWSNLERFDQLRSAAASGTLFSLEDLLSASPQDLIDPPVTDPTRPAPPHRARDSALTYYAQIWALVHFLREAEGGRYSAHLTELLSDAANGRLSLTLSLQMPPVAAKNALASRRGPALFTAYFTPDLAAASAQYARFIDQVVRPGSRTPIVDGKSPVEAATAAGPSNP